jgi:osmotically-inducible protein OsmY
MSHRDEDRSTFHPQPGRDEHGYQDPRDQRDREHGRDDVRGLDREMHSDRSSEDHQFGDRFSAGRGGSQGGRDQFAERDRNMYADRDRDWASSSQRSEGRTRMGGDTQRGSGYGSGDGSMGRERTSYGNYGGQSGSQAGGRYGNQGWSGQGNEGGSRGHWGDFDRGGQSGDRGQSGYDTQSPYNASNDRSYGGQGYGQRDSGEQSWGEPRMRGPHAGKGPQGFQRSDERIKEQVHEALTDHDHLDATHITVDVKNGDVTLTGTVDDRQAKRLAEDVVERCTGVKEVQNQLRIQTSSRGGSPAMSSSSTGTSHLDTTSQAGTDASKKTRPS